MAERKAKFIWGGVIIGFLTLEIIMCLFAATLATGDASFAVVPGYHEQGLNWDETVAARRASDDLAWTANVGVGAPDVLGRRTVTIALADRGNAPVAAARVTATVFHHSRAGDVQAVDFAETAPGIYTTTAEMRREGLWEFRIEAHRGDERFLAVRPLEL